MSTLQMKEWNQRDFSGITDLEDEFEQIPMALDANGKDMNYGSRGADRDERVRLAKQVKEKHISFPQSKEARNGRERGEIKVTE